MLKGWQSSGTPGHHTSHMQHIVHAYKGCQARTHNLAVAQGLVGLAMSSQLLPAVAC